MSQVTLVAPDSHSKSPATRDQTTENGWSFKRVLDALNTMLTEIYASLSAAATAASVTAISDDLATATQTRFVDVTVTTAELLALNATPKTIVAAPGSGFGLVFDSIVVVKPAGTAYAGIAAGEDLAVKDTDESGTAVATIETTGFLDQTDEQVRFAEAYRAASGVNSVTPSNTPLVLHLLTGEITTGDSDLNLRVYYRVIPTTL